MKIEIRFHIPQFSKKAVSEYLNGKRLPNWVSPKPDWNDVKKLRPSHNISGCHITDWEELLNILAPSFKSTRHGVYFSKYYNLKKMEQDYKRYGRFNAEGGYHIHLKGITKNPVHQFELGVTSIFSWIEQLNKINNLRKIVIYLNGEGGGSKNFILCLYSNPTSQNISFLENDWLPITKMSDKAFIKWAK
jgi:hypothetical protein